MADSGARGLRLRVLGFSFMKSRLIAAYAGAVLAMFTACAGDPSNVGPGTDAATGQEDARKADDAGRLDAGRVEPGRDAAPGSDAGIRPEMLDVATGEYSTHYLKADGTVWVTYPAIYDVSFVSTQLPGLTNIVEMDGGQYTSLFRAADGKVYSGLGQSLTSTAYPVDNTGAPFTADKIYANWRMAIALKDGEVWYWSVAQKDAASQEDMLLQFGSLGTPVPAPRKLVQPPNKKIVKCVFGSSISPYTNAKLWGLASDGTLWQWDQTHKTPFQVTGKTGFPGTWDGSVVDVALTADVSMVVTSTNKTWCWGYNGGLYGCHYDYENKPMDEITANMTAAGVVFPLKQIIANYKCIQLIDANNNKFGIGNNQEGDLGSGYMSPSWRTSWNGASNSVYNFDFISAHGNQGTWIQQPGKYLNIKTNTSFVFYSYGQDMAGNWYSWGRGGKAQSLGNGITEKQTDQVKYNDYIDIPAPRLVRPITQTWTILPYIDVTTPRDPLAHAGINQYLGAGVTQTTLYGSGSHQQQPTNTLTVTMANLWTQTSGPNTAMITSPTTQNTSVTGMIAGTYIFRNTVTNSLGAKDFQEVTVVIGP